jgi:hypothetical protein
MVEFVVAPTHALPGSPMLCCIFLVLAVVAAWVALNLLAWFRWVWRPVKSGSVEAAGLASNKGGLIPGSLSQSHCHVDDLLDARFL